MNTQLAAELVALLPKSSALLFNPWRDRCEYDSEHNGPEDRLRRLAQHLDVDARLILVGEAPGYQGARYSGVAFTSERLLLEGRIPRVEAPAHRLTRRSWPFSEPSGTTLWNALHGSGLAAQTVIWNSLQLHPYPAGEVHSNRTTSASEVRLGAAALKRLVMAYPSARILAVGKKAENALHTLDVECMAVLRHPARGGATQFTQGLFEAIKRAGLIA